MNCFATKQRPPSLIAKIACCIVVEQKRISDKIRIYFTYIHKYDFNIDQARFEIVAGKITFGVCTYILLYATIGTFL